MGNPAAPPEWEETRTATRSLSLQAELLDVRNQDALGRAFELAVRQHVDALLIRIDGLTQMYQQTILDLVARNRLPAAYSAREFVEAGGLMAYAVRYRPALGKQALRNVLRLREGDVVQEPYNGGHGLNRRLGVVFLPVQDRPGVDA